MNNPKIELMNTDCFLIKELKESVVNSLILEPMIQLSEKSADDIFKKEVKTCQI